MKEINNELIRSFNPCYDPKAIGIDDSETLSVIEWVEKYRDVVNNQKDIIWLLCRNEFMSDKDMRLFAIWCARESFKLQTTVDQRSIDAVNCAERYANGKATDDELRAAKKAAWSAASSAAWSATESAVDSAARETAASAAWSAAWSATASAAESAAESALESAWSAAASAAESARSAAREAAREAQINKLLTYFKEETK